MGQPKHTLEEAAVARRRKRTCERERRRRVGAICLTPSVRMEPLQCLDYAAREREAAHR